MMGGLRLCLLRSALVLGSSTLCALVFAAWSQWWRSQVLVFVFQIDLGRSISTSTFDSGINSVTSGQTVPTDLSIAQRSTALYTESSNSGTSSLGSNLANGSGSQLVDQAKFHDNEASAKEDPSHSASTLGDSLATSADVNQAKKPQPHYSAASDQADSSHSASIAEHSPASSSASTQTEGSEVNTTASKTEFAKASPSTVAGSGPTSMLANSSRIAVLVSGLTLEDGETKAVLWTLFDGMVAGLLRSGWVPDLHFCIGRNGNRETIEMLVTKATVSKYSHVEMQFFDVVASGQFSRYCACYRSSKEAAKKQQRHYVFWIRTRPDIIFGFVDLPRTASQACLHARLRFVGGLQKMSCQSTTQQGSNCRFAAKSGPCLILDDQFAIVPASLADDFFGWSTSGNSNPTIYSHPGTCTQSRWPETRLTAWVLKNKLRVCPLGMPDSGANFNIALHKRRISFNVACDLSKTYTCGENNLPYAEWWAAVLKKGDKDG
mmetsp:Transcript_53103/g.134714  ORF Transcript_53103/g.134714 Transcript_53103/m.134714 type:complete len:492 (-) Transcript_53103:66-1541(-)